MTLGWRVSVHRQADDRVTPSADDDPKGARVAIWRADVGGLRWLKDLAQESDDAVHVADNSGYPVRYTALAGVLVPIILDGPPGVRSTPYVAHPSDIVGFEHLPGGAVVDRGAIDECQAAEWLQVEAWDES